MAPISAVDLLNRHTRDSFGIPRDRYNPDAELRAAMAHAENTGKVVYGEHGGYVLPSRGAWSARIAREEAAK